MNAFRQLHEQYFALLGPPFQHLASEVRRTGISTDELVADVMSRPGLQDVVGAEAKRLSGALGEFWVRARDPYLRAVRELPGLRATFGGDIGPQPIEKFFEHTGLYYDTIVLPDPLHRASRIPSTLELTRAELMLKYAVNQCLAQEVFLAQTDPPIAVLVPDDERYGPDLEPQRALASWLLVRIARQLWDRHFSDLGDLVAFVSRFASAEEAVRAIVQSGEIVFRADSGDVSQQWIDLLRRRESKFKGSKDQWNSPSAVLALMESQVLLVLGTLERGETYVAQPMVPAPVTFRWLQRVEAVVRQESAAVLPELGSLELPLTSALLQENLRWLGCVNVEQLVTLRRRGELADMRALFAGQGERLRGIRLGEVNRIAREVDHDLRQGLARHKAELDDLAGRCALEFGLESAAFLVSIASMIAPVTSGWIVGAASLLGGASAIKLLSTVQKLALETKRLQRTALGILWSASQRES